MMAFRRIASAASSTIRIPRPANTLSLTPLRTGASGTVLTKAFRLVGRVSLARARSNIAASGSRPLHSETSQSATETSGKAARETAGEKALAEHQRLFARGEFLPDEPLPYEGPNDKWTIRARFTRSKDDSVVLHAKMRAWARNAECEISKHAPPQEDGASPISIKYMVGPRDGIWMSFTVPARLRPVIKGLVRECPDIIWASPYPGVYDAQ